jgi:hypothetical protein
VIEPLLGAPAPVHAGRRRERIRIEVRFARRGLRRLEPPRLVLRDPLSLAVRTLAPNDTAPVDVLVLPRTEPVEVRPERDASGAGRALAALAGAAEVELDGLRAYRPAPRPRVFTGRPWPAAPGCSSAGCAPTATGVRSSCSTPPARAGPKTSTPPCGRRHRS